MRVREFRWYSAVPGIAAGFLIGCGGGGGGYGGGMTAGAGGGGGYGGMPAPPPPPPMPTVSFTSPAQAQTINFGQGVQLAWTSANATSCSASTSSTMGGAFTGTQPTSGTATVAPTGTGSVTYTLTCTGTGGSASATTAAVTVNPSVLSTLSKITTIGKTNAPIEGGGNPYGLAIAPVTAGLITAGDLIVCNFNDGATNTQGKGTTIVGLHPMAGAAPYLIAQSASLLGCNALAILPDDSISAAAQGANANPLVTPTGTVNTPFAADTFASPWGEAYVPAKGANPAALYVSNIGGSIDRITLNGDAQTAFTSIATGFCGSGQPGAYFAPAGLTYDASNDTLYIVDTSSNSVVAFANVSAIGASGVVVNGQCQTTSTPPTAATPPTATPTFSGPSASSARVIAHGGGFNAPLSAALLADGDLVVANSDLNNPVQTPNLLFEISPVLPGGFVGQPVQLDNGAPAALFGLATTVDAQGHQLVYFNDDNPNPANSNPPINYVMLLSQ
jgi:hypothetical protein